MCHVGQATLSHQHFWVLLELCIVLLLVCLLSFLFIICSTSKVCQLSKFLLKRFRCISHQLFWEDCFLGTVQLLPLVVPGPCAQHHDVPSIIQVVTLTSFLCWVPSLFSICAVNLVEQRLHRLPKKWYKWHSFWGDFAYVYDNLAEYRTLNWILFSFIILKAFQSSIFWKVWNHLIFKVLFYVRF